jgi:RNA polymerase sigma-70 factor (ECF subfamily)
MLEDHVLIWKFKGGSGEALSRIYQKYKKDLLKLATILLGDVNDAEDVVHDVFLSFAQSAHKLRLVGSLKSYLLTCVANRARNKNRAQHHRRTVTLDDAEQVVSDAKRPDEWIISSEELQRWTTILARLPFDQREVIVLRLRAGMKFGQIAKVQGVSVNTVKGRYRYGLDRLRSILNGEVEK